MSTLALITSGVRTTDGDQDFGGWTPDLPLTSFVSITAVSGTSPVLTLVHEISPDGSTWYNLRQATYSAVGSSALITEPGTWSRTADLQQRYRWTVTGTTPSFTFSVTAYSATEGVR